METIRVAGIDIGNSTTEVCIARFVEGSRVIFECSASVNTTGIKGTLENIKGIKKALAKAVIKCDMSLEDIDKILLNEATPVIGDTAMQTITKTIITQSAMIGHNPNTPAGIGLGIGDTIAIKDLDKGERDKPYIVVADKSLDYEEVAKCINNTAYDVRGVILEKDEAVLVYNRLNKKIPIIDEVKYIDKVPLGSKAVIEVVGPGASTQTLANPYGIARLFELTPEETKRIIPIAKSLVGKRSGVVIKTPKGDVREKIMPAGKLKIKRLSGEDIIQDVDQGSSEIMKCLDEANGIMDIEGECSTNIGQMFDGIKDQILGVSQEESAKVTDILATDILVPITVEGAIAGEVRLEKAVAIAAMVKSSKLPMQNIANEVQANLKIESEVAGVEAVMASLGALTTRGVQQPLVVLDLGGGSTDAAILGEDGEVKVVHLAGAGNFVTMLIDTELGLNNKSLAENIKKYPLAKVESLFHVRLETGEIKFFEKPLPTKCFGKIVIWRHDELIPIEITHSLEKIVAVRKDCKRNVFVTNAIRALKKVAPSNNLLDLSHVVLVGGSALDFEIPGMLLEALSEYGIVVGKGEIRGKEGPRNAVATGLVLSKVGRI